MKKITDIFFSMRTSVVLLIVFAVAIGYATFVENSSGTPAAKALVYNASWFVVLLFLLIVNMIGMIVKTKLIERKKWSVLLFHSAFICILIGSAVTRYFGFEGIMHIRQGETSNQIMTEQTALTITAEYKGQKVEKSAQVGFSTNDDNSFTQSLQIGGKTITVDNELFVPNAQEMIEADDQGQPAAAVFVMSGSSESADMTLFGDEQGFAGDLSFGFTDGKDSADVTFVVVNDKLFFKSKRVITKTGTMASGMIDRANAVPITPGELCEGTENTVFRVDKIVFMIKGFIPKASKMLTQMTPSETPAEMGEEAKQGSDALVMRVSDGNVDKKINVLKSESEVPQPTTSEVNGVKVSVSYGKYLHQLPFSITLRKFELDRYQGSMSPSSYASEITLKDTEMKSEQPYRIFMNNILNYRGYRFFQSSYDQDEQGTILSVNHDYWGTFITYIGYLLLLIGMVLTLFDKNSRFQTLMTLTTQLQQKRKTTIVIALMLASSALFAAEVGVSKEDHLKAFNSLLIQDAAQGRIEPINTFASDILRKIYKKTTYGKKSPSEVFLGMMSNPNAWKKEFIIKVSHDQLAKELGAVNGYISYNQMIDAHTGIYKLSGIVDKAYIKDQSKRNTYEKEVVYVDERFNILSQIFDGTLLALFPVKESTDGKWASAKAELMMSSASGKGCPYHGGSADGMTSEKSGLTGEMPPMDDAEDAPADMPKANPHEGMGGMPPADPSMGPCTRGASGDADMSGMSAMPMSAMTTELAADSPEMLLKNYYDAVAESAKSGNYGAAIEKLNVLKDFQLKNGGTSLPSPSQVNLEIAYNEWNLFGNLSLIYFILGAILLGLHLVNIFKYSTRLEVILTYAVYPLALLFAVFTSGLALRWFISGHAPWSNGYESMVFVGWASSLAGLLFARKSPLAFSITALLSAIALMVAGMSWMNPEITNLVPVLKSYWLVVHVAVITSSYGFFAMGALLGLLNLILMIVRSKKKGDKLKSTIKEISYIIEMALIVGLFMLTVGNFLGGVWANESWGRYWGWDAKETWALVSILVYAVILHVRMIPRGNHPYILSSLAVAGFASVIMTFLGVNYYLSGMHSYGKGTPPPLPDSLFLVIVAVVIIVVAAFLVEKKNGTFKKDNKK
ncbi:MAG: cytochrome c biogenesis protein CcsA [Bacteroidales bacterium]